MRMRMCARCMAMVHSRYTAHTASQRGTTVLVVLVLVRVASNLVLAPSCESWKCVCTPSSSSTALWLSHTLMGGENFGVLLLLLGVLRFDRGKQLSGTLAIRGMMGGRLG